MSFTVCTVGEAIEKVGANVTALSGALLNNWSDEVESELCVLARYDIVTNFSSLTSPGKDIFQSLATDKIAQRWIGYDPTGMSSRESEFRLDILENRIIKNEALVKDDKNRAFLGIETG